jgi:hypothetical protein
MAYDPTLPANNSPIVSAELRNQFAGLKDLIDAQAVTITDLQAQINALKPPPTNIVLSYDGSQDNASWTYDGDAPPQWEISYSQDNGASWPTISQTDGGNSSCAPDVEPSLMRLRALDAANSPISDYSNSVNVG